MTAHPDARRRGPRARRDRLRGARPRDGRHRRRAPRRSPTACSGRRARRRARSRVAHDAISKGVYAGLRRGAGAIGAGAGAAAACAAARRPRRCRTRAAAACDRRAQRALRRHAGARGQRAGGADVGARRRPPGRLEPDAGRRRRVPRRAAGASSSSCTASWRPSTAGSCGGTGGSYGERLARDLSITPIEIRYNTGRHISENGASLNELLEELVAAWPVAGRARSRSSGTRWAGWWPAAPATGAEGGAAWVGRVRHVVSLGTPHMGAPMAQGVHYLTHGLSALPETRPFGDFFRRRSAGIRDLRHGLARRRGLARPRPRRAARRGLTEVPLLPGATHHFVSATISRDPRHPLGRLIGDWLVLQPSASGRGRDRRLGFRDEDGRHLGGTNHIALLNHPAVYEQLRQWLSVSPEPEVPALPRPLLGRTRRMPSDSARPATAPGARRALRRRRGRLRARAARACASTCATATWDAVIGRRRAKLERAERLAPTRAWPPTSATWARIADDVRGGMDAFRAGRLTVRHNLHVGVGFLAATSGQDTPGRLRFGRSTPTRTGSPPAGGAGRPVIAVHGLGAHQGLVPAHGGGARAASSASSRSTCRASATPTSRWARPTTRRSSPRAVVALLDALEIDRATSIGNSLGGRVALEVGLRHPERVSRLGAARAVAGLAARPALGAAAAAGAPGARAAAARAAAGGRGRSSTA